MKGSVWQPANLEGAISDAGRFAGSVGKIIDPPEHSQKVLFHTSLTLSKVPQNT
jgi:hypothetical protein